MREQLTRQSIQLFEEKGFSTTSVQDIVDSLGVTKGTFYYYFKSKEALLMDIHLRYIDELLERQTSILASGDNCREKLVKMIEMLIFDIQRQGSKVRVYFREMRHLTAENATTIREKRRTFELHIEQIIREGMITGEFQANLDPKITTFAILGVTNWSYQWFNPTGSVSAEKLVVMYTNFVLQGIDSKEE